MQLLTHSRQDCFKSCRKKAWFAYEQKIRPTGDARALRMGSAFHDALEALANGLPMDVALGLVDCRYDVTPERVPADEWAYEHETIRRLVNAYAWRWADSGIEYLVAEQSFSLPLLNPETGKPTPLFSLAGKIDGIVKLADGRLAVIEHKLLGEDIGPDSALWPRMQIDHQISLYVMAARRLGYPVDTVLYDCGRKPTIAPMLVPCLDGDGLKIVLDANGERVRGPSGDWRQTANEEKGFFLETVDVLGEWRQTGDTELGYAVQSVPMTPDEWGEKLNDDIATRPDFYFYRKEIPRMDGDLKEYERELWDIQLTIREAQRSDRWYRTVNKNTCGFCSYFSLCSNKGIDLRESLPEGFVRVTNIHPELGEEITNVNGRSTRPANQEGTTAPATFQSAAPF